MKNFSFNNQITDMLCNDFLTFGSKILLLIYIGCLTGCSYPVSFQELQYDIATPQYDESVVGIIENDTLEKKVSITSALAGGANSWDAMPGLMLKQVADVELPQMFKKYKLTDSLDDAFQDHSELYLLMTVPRYEFKDFHAFFTIGLVAYNQSKKIVLERTYNEEGSTQGAKMFWGGAFGMKSAVRQSSLLALKTIFKKIRKDLVELLQSGNDLYFIEDNFGF